MMSDFAIQRQNMVEGQIRPSSVTDWRIIDAMRMVPREAFVGDGQRALAYVDLDLDVGGEGGTKRYLIKPVITARMLQAAGIGAQDNVLVVGCASGYLAALVSRLAGKVVATECDAAIAGQAGAVLAQLGFGNVTVIAADASAGNPALGPYDVIVLNGATEIEPCGLYAQLKPGGRLVGVFAAQRPQRAMLVTRASGDYGTRVLFDASAPVLPGFARLPTFVF